MTAAPQPAPATPAEQRMEELLAAVRRVFAEKGFDGASMQDLARGAGISVGNFYRYFPSKAAIVEALMTRDLLELDGQFALVHAAPDPVQAARQLFRIRITEACLEDCQIWAEMTAAAMRKAELAEITRRMHHGVIGHLIRLFARATALPEDEAARRFRPQAELILMLVKGSNLNHTASGPPGEDLIALLASVVDRIVDDILHSVPAAKG